MALEHMADGLELIQVIQKKKTWAYLNYMIGKVILKDGLQPMML